MGNIIQFPRIFEEPEIAESSNDLYEITLGADNGDIVLYGTRDVFLDIVDSLLMILETSNMNDNEEK